MPRPTAQLPPSIQFLTAQNGLGRLSPYDYLVRDSGRRRRTCIDSSVHFARFHHSQCTKKTERKYAKQGAGELDKCPSTMKYHHHDHPKATTDQDMVPATPTMEDKAGDAWGPFLSKSIKYILDRYISLNIQRHCHK